MANNLQDELEQVETVLKSISTVSQIPGYQELCTHLIDSHFDRSMIFEPLDTEAFIGRVIELVEVQNRAGIYA